MERLGDRRFPGEGWAGNRGKKLRIEAFSIRPVDTLLARDIEFKALGPKGRQTPWVTDAKLCGTRGQGLPLTGFAIRLAPHVAERFEVVYQGSFFESGIVGPHRDGELCIPPITDDPLEAINVRLIATLIVKTGGALIASKPRYQTMHDVSSADEGAVLSKTVLNVGCGYPLRQKLHRHFHGPEWREIRLDLDPAVQPDIVCSITDISPVAADSVDAVWSSHNLEHLQRHEVPLALAEFLRVLKPHGLLLLTLPDLQQVARLVAEDRLEDSAYISQSGPITPLDMIFGHTASLARGNQFMAHRTGFTARTLHRLLIETGFVEVTLRQATSFDLWATGHKPGRG